MEMNKDDFKELYTFSDFFTISNSGEELFNDAGLNAKLSFNETIGRQIDNFVETFNSSSNQKSFDKVYEEYLIKFKQEIPKEKNDSKEKVKSKAESLKEKTDTTNLNTSIINSVIETTNLDISISTTAKNSQSEKNEIHQSIKKDPDNHKESFHDVLTKFNKNSLNDNSNLNDYKDKNINNTDNKSSNNKDNNTDNKSSNNKDNNTDDKNSDNKENNMINNNSSNNHNDNHQQKINEINLEKIHPDFPLNKMKDMFGRPSELHIDTYYDVIFLGDNEDKVFKFKYIQIFEKISSKHKAQGFNFVYSKFMDHLEIVDYEQEKILYGKEKNEKEKQKKEAEHSENIIKNNKEINQNKKEVPEDFGKNEINKNEINKASENIININNQINVKNDKSEKKGVDNDDKKKIKKKILPPRKKYDVIELGFSGDEKKKKKGKKPKVAVSETPSESGDNGSSINNKIHHITENKVETLSKSSLIIEIQIKFPEGSQRFLQLKHFFEVEIKEIFKAYLNKILCLNQYTQEDCDKTELEREILIKDTFSAWSFDVFFGLFKIFVIKKEGKFPTIWKIDPNCKKETYQLKIVELKKEVLNYDENMDIFLFVDNLELKTGRKGGKIFKEAKETFQKQGLRKVADLIHSYAVQDNIFDDLWGIKKEIIDELNNFSIASNKDNSTSNIDYLKEDLNLYEKPAIMFFSNLHKVKRFFYYKLGKGDQVGYLSKSSLDRTYEVLIKEYKNEYLLDAIKRFYYCLTYKKESFKEYSIPRGVLFYGPPGTGKTTVAEKFPDLIGLTPISYPISSTEVNRGIVGETEKLLQELCQRAHRVPHLICYLSVDEIDALVPRRDDKENKNKGDSVATLLSLIGGIKDVPNLIFVASTNFMKKIDEAFSRRMSGKFFVGRLDKDGRQKFLKDINNALTENAIDQALKDKINEAKKNKKNINIQVVKEKIRKKVEIKKNQITEKFMQIELDENDHEVAEEVEKTYEELLIDKNKFKDIRLVEEDYENSVENVSEDNLEEDRTTFSDEEKEIVVYGDSKDKAVDIVILDDITKINPILINFTPAAMKRLVSDIAEEALSKVKIVDLKKIKQIAAKCAKQFNIRLGNYYLPEIVDLKDLKNRKEKSRIIIPNRSYLECLGLIIIDLQGKEIKFKVKNEELNKICFEDKKFKTNRPIASASDILLDIAEFAFHNEIVAGQLVDIQALLNNGAYDEQKIFENITETTAEMKEYPKSMIIFDLDSLVGVNISKSDGMGNSTSKSMGNSKLFYYIKDIANNDSRVTYDYDKNNARFIDNAMWGIIVVRDEYLLENLIECLGIEKSEKQKKREEKDKKEQEKVKTCVRCKKDFKEKDNKNLDACIYHSGDLYDSSLPPSNWKLYDYYEGDNYFEIEIQAKSYRDKLQMEKKKEEGKRKKPQEGDEDFGELGDEEEDNNPKGEKSPFVWICCKKHYGEQGCRNGLHTDAWMEFVDERKLKWEKYYQDFRILQNRAKQVSKDLK